VAILVVSLEFGGHFGISPNSVWQSLLGILAAGCTFGIFIGVVLPCVAPDERFKQFCVCTLAGGAAGTVAWLIAQPDTSIAVAVGANALLGALFYLFG